MASPVKFYCSLLAAILLRLLAALAPFPFEAAFSLFFFLPRFFVGLDGGAGVLDSLVYFDGVYGLSVARPEV